MKNQKWNLRLLAVGLMALAGVSVVYVAPAEASACTSNCQRSYSACTRDCLDEVGTFRGLCLRMCKSDYNACLRGC